jgi:hypothetical protein
MGMAFVQIIRRENEKHKNHGLPGNAAARFIGLQRRYGHPRRSD